MEGLPSGTVTFLFTDIEGSTPLWDSHPSAMREALTRHDEILRTAIADAGGYVFATGGDGFCVAFHGAGSAVAAAMDAQRALAAEPWPEHVGLQVRMGLHSGEADERDGNYYGATVNRAARLMGAANGGQVVASSTTAKLIEGGSVDIELHDLGSVRLKGMVEPVRVFGVATPDLPWIDQALVSRQTSAGNLPRPQTELVGDLVDLQRRVATLADTRLVTLTGSGGVGKTRAAIEIGWLVLDDFPDGAWLVDLAPVADPDLVDGSIASSIGAQPQPGLSLVESIVDWCTDRRVLLIIDNCEHVLGPTVEVVRAIVAGAPTATILATSREPLGLTGEQVIRVPSLEPEAGAELFGLRAAAAGAPLAGTSDEAAAVEAICRRLDGIPLAIEIAAARTRSLSPEELLARLDERFRLLRGGRGGIERHQTLRATVAWSYQLLSDQQRLLFDRLSVFSGGFDLSAAEAICSDATLDELDIVDLLGELVDKSMVVADRTSGTTRYRLLETLRQYGEECLADRGEAAGLRNRHLGHYATFGGSVPARWRTAEQLEIIATISAEWDNLRAAHGWAIACDDVGRASDILAGVDSYARYTMRHESSDWVDQTLALADATGEANWWAFRSGAEWAWHRMETDRALALASQALEVLNAGQPDELSLALATTTYISAATSAGLDVADQMGEARAWATSTRDPAVEEMISFTLADSEPNPAMAADDNRRLVAAAHRTQAPLQIAEAIRHAGNLARFATLPPDLGTAMARYQEAIALGHEHRSVITEGWAHTCLFEAASEAGRADANALGTNALRFANEAHYPLLTETTLVFVSLHLAMRMLPEEAAVTFGYVHERTAPFPIWTTVGERVLDAIADLDNIAVLLDRGEVMSRAEIVAYATAALDSLDSTGVLEGGSSTGA